MMYHLNHYNSRTNGFTVSQINKQILLFTNYDSSQIVICLPSRMFMTNCTFKWICNINLAR